MPAPLTVVIPTLNEASQIAECVRGLAWAGEVIVVDAGSGDGTAAAARAAGARVLDGAAPGIAAQRNAGIAAATHEWVFALDADERIGPELAAELAAVAAAPRHEAYRGKRRNLFHGHVLRRGRWGRDWVVRLFRRDRRFCGQTAHPGLQGVTDFGALRYELDHTPYRDLRHHLEKLITYSRMSAADLAAGGARFVERPHAAPGAQVLARVPAARQRIRRAARRDPRRRERRGRVSEIRVPVGARRAARCLRRFS